MSFNSFGETPFGRMIRLAMEEQQKKEREKEEQLKRTNLLRAALLAGGAPTVTSRSILSQALELKKVFVSFDYDNDKHYKYLLEAWHSNPKFKFVFRDATPDEIQSSNINVIKQGLVAKIYSATHTLVIVGRYANSIHKDYKLIGSRNWINYEINRSKYLGKKIAAVKLDKDFTSPEELLDAGASWAMSFTEDSIIRALERA